MEILPILKENAYLTLLIKDNFVHANLSYTNFSAQRTFILSDSTDLSPLKFRLDDFTFTKNFWFEYFDALEKLFDWDIIERKYEGVFQIKEFEKEEVGVSGIKVLVDDNQPFFQNIFNSLKDFSKDIHLKIMDDRYVEYLSSGFLDRLGYSDVVWLDLDISHFTLYRAHRVNVSGGIFSRGKGSEIKRENYKIGWSNEIGLIDFIKSSKLRAFLSGDSSSDEISNRWANLIAHNREYILDPVLRDVLRAFTTLQLLSIRQANRDKLGQIIGNETAIFLTGNIVNLLTKRELLFSIIDGLELEGIFDLYVDKENRFFSLGKSLIEKEKANDIAVVKGDVMPTVFKLIIPEVPLKSRSKVIFSGQAAAQNVEPRSLYAFGSSLQILKLPDLGEKVIVSGELKNSCIFPHLNRKSIEFLSVKRSLQYEYLIVDGRLRPIVYGPSAQSNRVKFKIWGDADKE